MAWCSCQYQCGPYVEDESGYNVLDSVLSQINIISTLYTLVFKESVFLWAFLILAMTSIFLRENSASVREDLMADKDDRADLREEVLKKRIRALENKNKALREAARV